MNPLDPSTLRRFALAFALVLMAPLVSNARAENPSEVVERFHGALIDTMRNADELGYDGRFEKLSPLMEQTFDLDFMAEKSVGRHWKKLDPAARERWLDTFERLTTANYAGRFDAFSGQSFVTMGEEPAAHETVVVRTRLVLPDEDDVQLNYRLRRKGDGWRVVDVYLNGTVSELALRRSEYSTVLKRDGFESLVTNLEEKVAELAGDAPASTQ